MEFHMFYLFLLMGFLPQVGHSKEEDNSFLFWAKQYAQDAKHFTGWICAALPTYTHERYPWWVSPLQGRDWDTLQRYIHEEQEASVALRAATSSDVSKWPINLTLNHEGHGAHFSKIATDAITQRLSKPFLPKDKILPVATGRKHRLKHGYFQIRDEHVWLTPALGQLSQKAPLCWEQRNHSRYASFKTSTYLGWIPPEQCQHTILLKAEDWFATDWSSRPGVRWAAPNGTQWLCGANLWPWLPPGWIGRCTLGFPWMHGRWRKTLGKPARLSVLKRRRARGLSSNPVHSVGLRDVNWQIESLIRYLDKALKSTARDRSGLNGEAQLMRKAELQRQMTFDTLRAAKGGACQILGGECCVYIGRHSGSAEHGTVVLAKYHRSAQLEDSMWASVFKTPGGKWLIIVPSIILALLFLGPYVEDCLLSLIFSYFQSVFLHTILSHANPRMYPGPPPDYPGPEIEQESGP